MIEKILFPVDLSPSRAAMAAYVRRAADIFGSQVALVYVCDLTSSNGFELMVRTMRDVAEDHLCIARERLSTFLPSEFPPCGLHANPLLWGSGGTDRGGSQGPWLRSHHHAHSRRSVSTDASRVNYGKGAKRRGLHGDD